MVYLLQRKDLRGFFRCGRRFAEQSGQFYHVTDRFRVGFREDTFCQVKVVFQTDTDIAAERQDGAHQTKLIFTAGAAGPGKIVAE